MSLTEVSVSGVLTRLFPSTTMSLTLHVSRSGILSGMSWHKSCDFDNIKAPMTKSQIHMKMEDKQEDTSTPQFKLSLAVSELQSCTRHEQKHRPHLLTVVKIYLRTCFWRKKKLFLTHIVKISHPNLEIFYNIYCTKYILYYTGKIHYKHIQCILWRQNI